MANWINGHTSRFRALVSHAGVFNLEAMYGATEELWFVEWEFGGPYWVNRQDYERWSPHRFVSRFRTPTLVIHGALDYRVPDTEGLQMYTALQRQGVPSRLLYLFPRRGALDRAAAEPGRLVEQRDGVAGEVPRAAGFLKSRACFITPFQILSRRNPGVMPCSQLARSVNVPVASMRPNTISSTPAIFSTRPT
jgi:hypothetical protein